METVAVCPECGERAVPRPPRTPLDYAAAGLPVPRWSHLDGEPLCPVRGPGGYRPAEPVRVGGRGAEPDDGPDFDDYLLGTDEADAGLASPFASVLA